MHFAFNLNNLNHHISILQQETRVANELYENLLVLQNLLPADPAIGHHLQVITAQIQHIRQRSNLLESMCEQFFKLNSDVTSLLNEATELAEAAGR